MPSRGSFVRLVLGLGLGCGLALAMVGGLALRGPGLIAVGAAGVLSACLAAGVARDDPRHERRAMAEAAVLAAAWTIGGLLVLAGTAALAGGAATALLAVSVLLIGGVVWLVSAARAAKRRASGAAPRIDRPSPLSRLLGPPPGGEAGGRRGEAAQAEVTPLLPPVVEVPTRDLGREWLRSTAALAARLDPAVRAAIVGRREDVLDELERRDPIGFARWVATGPEPGSDPADWLRRDATGSTEAA